MTDVRPTLSRPTPSTPAAVPGVRPLTADEQAYLDRARAHLRASGADVADARSVGALLHTARTAWAQGPGSPVPQAMVMALGVGVGDLVVAGAPGSRWVLRTGGSAPTPAVVSATGLDAALPLADVAARWQSGCGPEWVDEYVTAAAAHLGAALDVPTPRTAPPPSPTTTSGEAPALPARRTAETPVAPPFRTPADLPYPPSTPVQDLALGVLDQALDVALAPGGLPAPFAVVDGAPGAGHDVRGFDGDPAQAVRDARAWVGTTGAARAAVAWFGRLPGDGGEGSVGPRAVFVEASGAGEPSLVVAHRYATATPEGQGRPRPARPMGEPIVLAQGAPLL